MIYQYAFNISKITGTNEVLDLFPLISEERKERISRFRFEKDKLHCLFAEVLLRYALEKRYQISDLVLDKNVYGKPYLVNHSDIYFNLSHSGDWVICGVGDQNLGIDVERVEEIEMSIARDFFARKEIDYLETVPFRQRLNAFYTVWTLKESYTKYVGEGMSIPLDSFAIIPEKERITLFLENAPDLSFCFQTQDLDSHHKMALCLKQEEKDVCVEDVLLLSLDDLVK